MKKKLNNKSDLSKFPPKWYYLIQKVFILFFPNHRPTQNIKYNQFIFIICSIIKQFAQNKDDRRRVEKALDVSGLPSDKGNSLPLSKFQFEDFFNLYKNLTQRTDVEKIFDEL